MQSVDNWTVELVEVRLADQGPVQIGLRLIALQPVTIAFLDHLIDAGCRNGHDRRQGHADGGGQGRVAPAPEDRTAPGPHAPGQDRLLFSSQGRGMELYGQADHDSNAFRRLVGDVPLGGFFCSGEIGPIQNATYLHGYTSAFAVFREKK